jgi:hypothetical protein
MLLMVFNEMNGWFQNLTETNPICFVTVLLPPHYTYWLYSVALINLVNRMHWMKEGLHYNRKELILCANHFFLEEADANEGHVDHLMLYLHCFQIDRYRKLLFHEVWKASTFQVNYNFLNYMILVSWVSVVTGCRVDDDYNCQWRAVSNIFASSLRQHYPRGAKDSF